MMMEGNSFVCFTFFFAMDTIRSIIRLADDKVSEGDLQGAISYFETAFKESETANYIGGLFCCSKRLGDIYFYTVLLISLVMIRIAMSMQLVGMNMLTSF